MVLSLKSLVYRSDKIMEEKQRISHGGNEDHFEKLYNDHKYRLAQQEMLAKIMYDPLTV